MRCVILSFLLACATLAFGGGVQESSGWEFSEVTVIQHWPLNRSVDIKFFVRQVDGQASSRRAAKVKVSIGDQELPETEFDNLWIRGEGRKCLVWTPAATGYPAELDNVSVTLTVIDEAVEDDNIIDFKSDKPSSLPPDAAALTGVNGYAVSDVRIFSQRPWDKGVDVWFTVTPPPGGTNVRAVELDIVASNGVDEVYISDAAILSRMASTRGRQHLVWRPDIDHPGVTFGQLKLYISVKKEVLDHPPYLYVNLGDGSVGYAGLGFAKAATKAFALRDNLVFRYIPPTTSDEWKEITCGRETFSFGMPTENAGAAFMKEADKQSEDMRHEVKLTKGFYFGVTPLTVGQCAMLGFKGKNRQDEKGFEAVRGISYEAARGEDVPNRYDYPRTDEVAPDSIVGKVRSLTGLRFDLPTNFQWEYALRVGSTNAYLFTETDRVPTEDELGQLWHHSHVPTDRPPNGWGIYGFIGCCHQWTLTLGRTTDSTSADNYYLLTEDATDPTGPSLAYDHGYRITRGSHADVNDYDDQKRAYRIGYKYPMKSNDPADLNNCGVRLCLALDD